MCDVYRQWFGGSEIISLLLMIIFIIEFINKLCKSHLKVLNHGCTIQLTGCIFTLRNDNWLPHMKTLILK